MNETLTLPPESVTVQRTCSLEDVFNASFIELLKLVPANPYVRALVLKFSGRMPPADCETFEELKDWVEFNCVKRIKPKNYPARNSEEGGIVINVDFSESEYGRANYSVERSGSDSFRINADDLMEIIQTAIADGEGIGDIVETIAQKIDDDAWNECQPNLDNYGDYDYDEHNSNDSGNSSTDYSKEEIRNAVLRFVRERHPELAAEL
jgi:hypothetical protein